MLSTVTEITTTSVIGWKLVQTNGVDKTPFCKDIELPIGKWVRDPNDYKLYAHDGQQYQTGFHIWKNKESAIEFEKSMRNCHPRNRRVIEVEFQDVVAEGLDVWGTVGDANLLEQYKPAEFWETVVARSIFARKPI
jgi:hypothetical protein